MSAITKVTTTVDDISQRLSSLPWPPPTSAAAADVAWWRSVRPVVDELCQRIDGPAVAGELAKLVAKARETDPDKKIFGPQMIERVLSLASRVDAMRLDLFARQAVLAEQLDPIDTREAAAAEQRRRDEEAAREAQRQADEARRLREEAEAVARATALARERVIEEQAALVRKAEAAATEREEEERKRVAALARGAQRDADRAQRAAEAADAEQRKRDAVSLGLLWSLEQLQRHAPSRSVYRGAVQTLSTIIGHIVEDPSNATFRRLRYANVDLQRDLLCHRGGVECLLSLGFEEHSEAVTTNQPAIALSDARPATEVIYILAEPDLRVQPDEWLSWFATLKTHRDSIAAALRHPTR